MNDKRHNHRLFRALLVGLILLLVSVTVALAASNIDPTHKRAWGTNVGWINLNPDNGGVTVYSDHLEGYAWGENIGWIRLGTCAGGSPCTYANTTASTYGVNNDGVGNLSGYAWSKDVGWINFAPTNGGVTVDTVTGDFDGYAWAENAGWIHFRTVQLPSSPFNEVATTIGGVGDSAAAWGDYDMDGDLDVLLVGWHPYPTSEVYRNNAGVFTGIGAGLVNLAWGPDTAWGDYNNDGYLDIVIVGNTNGGNRVSKIYRNNQGIFTDINAGLVPIDGGASVKWGDYDNDGDLDLLLMGVAASGRVTAIYRNDGGAFTDIAAGLPGVADGALTWDDYDNDGYLDILLTGNAGSECITKLYRNTGGQFTEVTTGLPGVCQSSVAWGDYDNDGYLDILLSGNTGTTLITELYRNDGYGGFVKTPAEFVGLHGGSVAWGDYDNDGYMDVLITGANTSGERLSMIYHNSEGTGAFTNIQANILGVYQSSAVWGDYDNDGDLDILLTGYDQASNSIAKIYRNDIGVANTPPTMPGNLSVHARGQWIYFSWDTATDAQTPAAGLTYNLRVGTTPGGSEVIAPMANTNSGYRHIPALGNAQHGLTATLRNLLPGHTYYWSVQAIDTAFAGSAFAPERSFSVPVPPLDVTIDGPAFGLIDAAYTFTATVAPVTTTLPLTYTWTPEPDAGQGSAVVTYTWRTGGQHVLQVTVENVAGAASGEFTMTVPVPPQRARLEGPPLGALNTLHTFTATIMPLTTTLPLTYTWHTAGAPPVVHPARYSLTDTAAFSWTIIGQQRVTVTAANRVGVVTATTMITIAEVPITGLAATNNSPTPLGQITTLTATVTSDGYITYTWNFGDNTTTNGAVVTHTYPNVGRYTAVVTASNSVNVITATTTVNISAVIYLPVVVRRWPPIPDVPVLNAISNPGGVGNYAVTWNTAYLATSYMLQEATDTAFSSPTTRYTGSGTSWNVSNKPAGTYYYRVKATNSYGDSGWSNVQPVQVLPPSTFYATGDADILQGYANSNFGKAAEMWVGYDDYLYPEGKIARSLIAFNTSAIPSTVAIDQAILRIYRVASWDYPGESRTITTYRISSPWSESSVTWNSQPTFAQAYGAASVSHDVARWYSLDVTNLVRGWINGTLPNYGIMLRGPEYAGSDSSLKSFSTREGNYIPQLLITYSGQTTQGIGANEMAAPTGRFTEAIIPTLTGDRPDSHAMLCSLQLVGEKCLTYIPYRR